jgi:hypothetical protein
LVFFKINDSFFKADILIHYEQVSAEELLKHLSDEAVNKNDEKELNKSKI